MRGRDKNTKELENKPNQRFIKVCPPVLFRRDWRKKIYTLVLLSKRQLLSFTYPFIMGFIYASNFTNLTKFKEIRVNS